MAFKLNGFNIWTAKDLARSTKMRVGLYEVLVLSCLLFNSETWTSKRATGLRLHVFEMFCLRKITEVTRRHRIRNEIIKKQLNHDVDILTMVKQRRLRCCLTIVRMFIVHLLFSILRCSQNGKQQIPKDSAVRESSRERIRGRTKKEMERHC